MHPVVLFSKKLSAAKHNYDLGDHESLAIKLALEEWSHWLEGAANPFVVLTDHKNLEYLHNTRWLNPRQARWALFFARFMFTLSYQPGSKNTKADALSQLYSTEREEEKLTTTLPATCWVNAKEWEVDREITESSTVRTPESCPTGKVFVPSHLRGRLITWAHTCPATGHPGISRTLELLSRRYWWPRMRVDVQRYVTSCTACARAKVPCTFPTGKLLPLPTPQRSWSHLSIDFITDLPKSDEMMTIVTIVDRFSKALRLIPLSSLPTALSLAEVLFTQVFRHYGIPEDIMSDQGP